MLPIILSFLLAYLIGGLNFSIITSRYFLNRDVRKYGSGNAGFTNSLRNFGKGVAAMVLAGDLLKTVLAVCIARLISDEPLAQYLAGLGAILGHNFPAFYRFKGGKGIVTTATVFLMLDPIPALIVAAIAVLIMFVTGYVSVGSFVILAAFPILTAILHSGDVIRLIFTIVMALLGFYMHRENIKKLAHGTENRFGKGKKA
jgi:glycerol-3-phosphate acyltransferase PlsY